jgi:hypothetical protein
MTSPRSAGGSSARKIRSASIGLILLCRNELGTRPPITGFGPRDEPKGSSGSHENVTEPPYPPHAERSIVVPVSLRREPHDPTQNINRLSIVTNSRSSDAEASADAIAPRTESPLASLSAALAGIAWITWAVFNARTNGGLDVGASVVGERLGRLGQLLIVAWNVLLIPAAVSLYARLVALAPQRMRVATVCGVASLLLWAYGAATRTITPALEVSYLLLSAVWWTGIGATARHTAKWFGVFTMVLGAFAAWDALLTAFEPVPFSLYVTAAPKLPLSILWDFAVAFVLLRGQEWGLE